MGNMKKITKITAGIMSLALAFGTAGYLPKSSSDIFSASAQTTQQQTYEYELKNICIYNAYDFDGEFRIEAIPKVGGVYSTWYPSRILHLVIPLTADDGADAAEKKKIERNKAMIDELSEGTIVTLKIRCPREYQSLREAENEVDENFSSREREYLIDEIVYVKSPSVHFYGDINDDGVVDSFDLIAYRKYLADNSDKELTNDMFLNADINKNDEIDADDLARVTDYLLGAADTFYGNADIGSVRLDNTLDVLAEEGKATDEAFAKAEMKFGVELLKKCFDPTKNGEENLLISPLSVSTALAMTANGADGNTRDEMEKVLGNGLSLEDINEYMAYYVAHLPDEQKEKIYVANSIWIKNDPAFDVKKDFLEADRKYYDSAVYKTAFDDSTVNDVNGWVDKNTKGMIPTLLSPGAFKPEDLMMLINTIYFEAEWQKPYKYSDDGEFTDLDGNVHKIQRMDSVETMYFDLGDADAFKKPYAGGDYSFVGILPRDKDIVEYVRELDGEKLAEGLKEYVDPDTIELNVMIPKFRYNYSKSLKDILSDIGMSEAFTSNADFTKISESVNGPLYIVDVFHKTRIEVTEKGTKAAAVTYVMMMGNAAPPQKEKIYITLDRPFIYMIVDKNNVPVFIGAATQLDENQR